MGPRLSAAAQEEEERELEEVEDLLEYYLQRAANTQSEAERLLAGARDLEESIGVSLSARRFEVGAPVCVWGWWWCGVRAETMVCLGPLRGGWAVLLDPLEAAVLRWPPSPAVPPPLPQVNRLELLLSIASFAAALGAMVAGIFGMNLRSTLEMSVIGFWGTTAMIVLGSYWVSPRPRPACNACRHGPH